MHMIYFSCRISTEQQRVMLLGRSPSGPRKYFPIPVEHLEEEIRIRAADDGKLFREEFNVSLDFFFVLSSENERKYSSGESTQYISKKLGCSSSISTWFFGGSHTEVVRNLLPQLHQGLIWIEVTALREEEPCLPSPFAS